MDFEHLHRGTEGELAQTFLGIHGQWSPLCLTHDFTSGRISVVSNMSKLSASSFFMQEKEQTGRADIFYMGISGYQSLMIPSSCQIQADCIEITIAATQWVWWKYRMVQNDISWSVTMFALLWGMLGNFLRDPESSYAAYLFANLWNYFIAVWLGRGQ